MLVAAADAGQAVVASILGLAAAGVAGGVIAMAWSLHVHQLQLAGHLARREVIEPGHDAVPGMDGYGEPAKAANGNGHGNGNGNGNSHASGNGVPRSHGEPAGTVPAAQAARSAAAGTVPQAARSGAAPQASRPAPQPAIEGPDSVVIGEQARYRVRRSAAQQVVSWAAGGGAVSQASDPAHPDDLLLVADRPGNLMVSVRLREGLAERRETKAVTAIAGPEAAAPAMATRLLLQDWPLITVAVLVVGFTAALVALGSLAVGDFVALVAPLTALLAVVATTRRNPDRSGQPPTAR